MGSKFSRPDELDTAVYANLSLIVERFDTARCQGADCTRLTHSICHTA